MTFIETGLSQDPKVTITGTVPETIDRKKIVVERDIDLVMNCHVENLYAAMSVSINADDVFVLNV